MSRNKTHNKTNIFLNDICMRNHLKDDEQLGAFFGVGKSTVSSWRVRNRIPNRYLELLKAKDNNTALKLNMDLNTDYPSTKEILPSSHICDMQAEYTSHDNLIAKTSEILQTDSVFKKALDSNIHAFHEAVKLRTELSVAQTRLKTCLSVLDDTKIELNKCQEQVAAQLDMIEELRDEVKSMRAELSSKETGS